MSSPDDQGHCKSKIFLAIIGAGGHGRVVAEAAERTGQFSKMVFFDDHLEVGRKVMGCEVVGASSEVVNVANDQAWRFVVAVGDNATRLGLHRKYCGLGLRPATIVHPSATKSEYSTIGSGTVLFAGSVINPGVHLGEAVIVNTGATVDHDCELEDGVHLSPGVHLGGGVKIGKCSWLGVGVSVRNSVSIAEGITVGVGASVIGSILTPGVYVGVPARLVSPAPHLF